jgi:hypothetical protein
MSAPCCRQLRGCTCSRSLEPVAGGANRRNPAGHRFRLTSQKVWIFDQFCVGFSGDISHFNQMRLVQILLKFDSSIRRIF